MEKLLTDCHSFLCPLLLLFLFTGPLNCDVTMDWVPTSTTYKAGENASLECRFTATDKNIKVSWTKIQEQHTANKFVKTIFEEGLRGRITLSNTDSSATVFIISVDRNDTGLYKCTVPGKGRNHSSCGTFLHIISPAPEAFLKLQESTKNKIITAEGILLLICAVIPGTILLFRKRAENEKMQKLKRHLDEGENLYEGLNLNECSMYEDISRGLQSTYQDVANLKLADAELERP